MSEEIIKVLDNLGEKFGIAIDWTSQNIMPYLQELMSRFITYKNATGITQMIIYIIAIILLSVGIKLLIKWSKSEKFNKNWYDEDEVLFGVGLTISVICIIVFIILIIGNIFGIIQNICMPELTIIEYLKSMQ